MFSRLWCRMALHYVDWATHLPQLDELNAEDRLRILVGRCVPVLYHIVALKCKQSKKKCVVLSSGTYVPLEEDESKLFTDQ